MRKPIVYSDIIVTIKEMNEGEEGEGNMYEKGEVLVEVKDMCKNFGVTVALNHVDITIRRGEIRGLIGENGSGKSTVSSIIAGIQPATSGEMM